MKKLIFTTFSFLCLINVIQAQVIWKQTGGPTNGSTNSMSVDSLQRIYVCTGGAGVFQSNDHGVTWHGLNKGLRSLPVRWLESSTIEHGSSGTAVAYVYALTHKLELMKREITTISSDAQWQYLDSVVHDYRSSASAVDINQLMTNAKGYLYLATSQFGVIRSKDDGEHFDSVHKLTPRPDSFITCMAVDRKQNLFAVSYTKKGLAFVYRSTDDGDSWQKLPSPAPNPGGLRKILIADDGSILVGHYGSFTDGNIVFRSTDTGRTWNSVLNIPPHKENNIDQMRHAVKGSDLWLNAHGPTYRSTDNGATWLVTNPIKMGDEPFDLVIDSSSRMYQCAIPDGIFRSLDTGVTWENIDQTLLVQHLDGNMAISPQNNIVACSQFNMYWSSNQGDSWTQLENELDEGQVQLVIFDKENYLYYGTSDAMYRSGDKGITFDTVIRKSADAVANQIYSMEVSPKDELFVSTSAGIDGTSPDPWFVRSKDHGKTWKRINTSNDFGIPTYLSVYNTGFTPTDPSLDDTIYTSGASNMIYRSINDGVNWEVVNKDGNGIRQFLCDSAGSVFRLEDRIQGGLYHSVDGGVNWTKVFPDTSNGDFSLDLYIEKYRSMMLDRKGRVVISTSDTSQAIGGIYRSTNSTFTKWENVTSGLVAPDYYPDRPLNAQMIVQNPQTGVYFANTRGASVFKTLPDMATLWSGVPAGHLSPSITEPVNYPNPFSKLTQIDCDIEQSGPVKISVYDVMGRLMKVLYDGYMDAGKHSLSYDIGTMASSGKYVVVVQSAVDVTSHWMTVTK
jgi:photosystem II stability/assembly factor-like uncharacterized protein